MRRRSTSFCAESRVPAAHYCAEPFLKDGSVSSGLMKSLKRVMAKEYRSGAWSPWGEGICVEDSGAFDLSKLISGKPAGSKIGRGLKANRLRRTFFPCDFLRPTRSL
jgi:hypothetical protein